MRIEHWNDKPLTEEGMIALLEARGYGVSRYLYPPRNGISAAPAQRR